MRLICTFVLSLSFILLAAVAISQDFEGEIIMKETHRGNVITKRITVKGAMVLLETFAGETTNDLKGAKIVNLKDETIIAMIPSRKLYFNVPNHKHDTQLDATVDATGKTKNIEVSANGSGKGYTCHQVIVKAPSKRAGVAFWIAKDNFAFFGPLMSILNRNENISQFFTKISDKHPGSMPLLAIERRPDGTEISRRTVTEINAKTIDSSVFNVPEDYTLQER